MRDGRRRGRDPRAHPDERPLRARRTRAATPTARSPTSRTCPATPSSAGAGSGTSSGRRMRPRCSSTRSACSGSRSSGLRFGGPRLAALLAFAWAAYPFTLYVSNSNTNDAIMPAFLIWGFWLASSAVGARRSGRARRLDEVRRAAPRPALARRIRTGWRLPAAGALRSASRAATLAAFSVLLLEPDPLHARARLRRAHVRLPARPRVAVLDLGLGAVPRRGRPRPARWCSRCSRCSSSRARSSSRSSRAEVVLQLAALTAAVLIGFELVLTHWFYLYIPWFFPFVAFALLYARARPAPVH